MSGGGRETYLPACLYIHRRYNGDWVKETAMIQKGRKNWRFFRIEGADVSTSGYFPGYDQNLARPLPQTSHIRSAEELVVNFKSFDGLRFYTSTTASIYMFIISL